MRNLPPEPRAGDRISATTIGELIRAVRERTIISGHGIRTSVGPNGTVVNSTATASTAADKGSPQCFDIKSVVDGSVTLTNCYFAIGGSIHDHADMTCEDCANCIVALAVDLSGTPTPSLCTFTSIMEMKSSAADDKDTYYRALYWFDNDLGVKVDMRSMPELSPFEFE